MARAISAPVLDDPVRKGLSLYLRALRKRPGKLGLSLGPADSCNVGQPFAGGRNRRQSGNRLMMGRYGYFLAFFDQSQIS